MGKLGLCTTDTGGVKPPFKKVEHQIWLVLLLLAPHDTIGEPSGRKDILGAVIARLVDTTAMESLQTTFDCAKKLPGVCRQSKRKRPLAKKWLFILVQTSFFGICNTDS
jgi:hypothetical protein